MDTFEKFAIGKATVIEADLKDVGVNLHAKQVTILITKRTDPRAENRLTLDKAEAMRLHRLLSVAIVGL